jgi:hypothetical protein
LIWPKQLVFFTLQNSVDSYSKEEAKGGNKIGVQVAVVLLLSVTN